jgi:hypothetical protein
MFSPDTKLNLKEYIQMKMKLVLASFAAAALLIVGMQRAEAGSVPIQDLNLASEQGSVASNADFGHHGHHHHHHHHHHHGHHHHGVHASGSGAALPSPAMGN